MVQDVSPNMSVEEWSVVPPRDRQAKQRQAHGSEKREASNGAGDESLIGSYVYRLDRSPLTPLDSDLIGAPFVISEPDQGNVVGVFGDPVFHSMLDLSINCKVPSVQTGQY